MWEKSLAMVTEAKTSLMWGDLGERFSTSYDFSHFFHVCRDKKCASDGVNGFLEKIRKLTFWGVKGQGSAQEPGVKNSGFWPFWTP